MRKVPNPFWLKTCGNLDVPWEKLKKKKKTFIIIKFVLGKQIVGEIQYGLFAKPLYDDI